MVEGSVHVPAGIWAEGAIVSKDYRYTRRGQGSPPQNRGVLTPTEPGAASRAQGLVPGADIGGQGWPETEVEREIRGLWRETRPHKGNSEALVLIHCE